MSPENPFKEQGDGPSAAENEPVDENEDEADKKLDAVMSEIGLKKEAQEKVKESTQEESGTDKPTKEDVMKAINTFKRVFQGKVIDKVKGIEEFCHNSDFMTRAVALVPFLSRFDPWLEYLGYIRDQQSSKK